MAMIEKGVKILKAKKALCHFIVTQTNF